MNMSQRITFFVPGVPAPGGSKRFVGFGKKTGKAILVDAAGQRNKDWRASVGWCGSEAMQGGLMYGPCRVRMIFFMPRPKGHFDSRGRLRPSAPAVPVTRPDVLKLARSTEDALTGIVWADDAQTHTLILQKRYASPGETAGCKITITTERLKDISQSKPQPTTEPSLFTR